MGPTQALTIVSAERRQSPADPAAGGNGHRREQPPVARVGQPKHVLSDLGRPVADEHTNGYVLINHSHDRRS